MRTLGSAFRDQSKDSSNNFLILRLLAATLVVFGHSGALSQKLPGYVDWIYLITGYRYSGDIGLHIFFVISGFLVFASYDNRKDFSSYLRARVLRIFPALIVFLLLVSIVLGGLLTTLSGAEYYRSVGLWKYIFTNASLVDVVWGIPSVMDGGSISGTLWTLGVEFRLYLIVGVLGLLGVTLTRTEANISILALVALAFAYPLYTPVIGGNEDFLRVSACFAFGSLLYINRHSVPLNARLLVVLVVLTALSNKLPSYGYMCAGVLAYGVFVFAFASKIKVPGFIEDFSYGIYLYGWPIQMLVHYLMPEAGPYKMMLISIPASWILGALSWHLVEKKCLSFKTFKQPSLQTNANAPA